MLWVTAIVVENTEKRINKIHIVKAVQIALYVIAFLFALNIIGIDLTTLTVFGGAVGIGLGFGLWSLVFKKLPLTLLVVLSCFWRNLSNRMI